MLLKSESGSLSSHQEKRKSLAFHQSEAILFLLTLFLFLCGLRASHFRFLVTFVTIVKIEEGR
ncbi:hypothetical protein ACT453_32720, partial [Bacillus sp. D-CC]